MVSIDEPCVAVRLGEVIEELLDCGVLAVGTPFFRRVA
jgi:hypothetical protein